MVADRPLGTLPGPAFESFDPAFDTCIRPDLRIERIWTGCRWCEGPAWLPGAGRLVWSDIPADRMMAWDEATGAVSVFRAPAGGPNGNTVDREGRLLSCEQGPHRITRTEADGTITVLVDSIDGRRFHSPNDLVVASDGAVWFSDPSYGRPKDRAPGRDVTGCHVYRFDPARGAIRQMTHDFVMPNGLAFSPDERVLYIVDTGSTERHDGPNHLRRFEIDRAGSLTGGEILIAERGGHFDGLRIDADGRLWMGADDGVRCYEPDGRLIGRIKLPERAANLAFGGSDGHMLFMTATTSVYACRINVAGAAP